MTFYLLALSMCSALAILVPNGGAAAILEMLKRVLAVILILFALLLGEGIGWRGYLSPLLSRRSSRTWHSTGVSG